MESIKLEIPTGYIIDLNNSSLEGGVINLVEKKETVLPEDFDIYSKEMVANNSCSDCKISEKYSDKLIVLDTLLNIRDEYLKSDPNKNTSTKCFRICILNHNISYVSCFRGEDRPFKFYNKEHITTFIENFKEQLEIIKEFL